NFNVGLTVAVATFIITWILNRFDLIGGGDVKLLFPTILLCENNLSAFWFGLSFGGGALALVYLFFGRRIILIRRNLARRLRILHKRPIVSKLLRIILLSLSRVDGRIATLRKGKFDPMKQEIPYGAAIACGGFYAIFENLAVR
ncbi:MAG: hypothetical protein LBL99_01565, partial [Holosporaceae bacterium]|nr:hypothetical protein [Holosporaceae bacterium]